MTSSRLTRRARLISSAMIGIATASAVVSPASAATPTSSVYGHVWDADGNPIRSVDVYVTADGKKYYFVGTTTSDGAYRQRSNLTIAEGTYYFEFDDMGRSHASGLQKVKLRASGNRLDATLQQGASLTGRVTDPSGDPLKNVCLKVLNQAQPTLSPSSGSDCTLADGTYEMHPFSTGSHKVYFATDGYKAVQRYVAFSSVGSQVTQDFINVKVPPVVPFSVTSPGRGKVALKVRVSATTYGITDPGGTVTIYDGSKLVKRSLSLTKGALDVTISGLKKGKHTFKLKYAGGTNTASVTSSVHSVTVK